MTARIRNRYAPLIMVAALLVNGLCSVPSAVAAPADTDMASLCDNLQRSNVDCACVGRRIARLSAAADDDRADAALREGYRASLGLSHQRAAALTVLRQDIQSYMRIEASLAALGGMPESIDDFEEGCLIPGAALAALPTLPSEPATDAYVEQCVAATGSPRYCACIAAVKRRRVDRDGFEAYYRSFADYSDDDATTLQEMTEARARAMGMQRDEYAGLQRAARGTIDAASEQDEAYCAALLWPDNASHSSADAGLTSGSAPASQNDAESATGTAATSAPGDSAASRYPKAARLLANGCRAGGGTDRYCACYVADADAQIFSQLESEAVAVAYALMQGGEGLPPMEMMEALSSLSSEEQMAAGIMAGTVSIGDACEGN